MARSALRSVIRGGSRRVIRGLTDEEEEEEKRRQKRFALAEEAGLSTKQTQTTPLLGRVFDILARPLYAFSQSNIRLSESFKKGDNVLDRAKASVSGAIEGITGKEKATTEDLLTEFGIGEGELFTTPQVTTPNLPGVGQITLGGKVTARGLVSLPADIILDPITYLTFGSGIPARVTLRSGMKVALNKSGRKLLLNSQKKVIKQTLEEGTALTGKEMRAIAEQKIARTVEKNLSKYSDPGGLKFMGKTIAPEAQRKIGQALEVSGRPFAKAREKLKLPSVQEAKVKLLEPVSEGVALKTAGFVDLYDKLRDIQRAPANIQKRSVSEVVDRFSDASGRAPTQAQLEEFFILADEGLPTNVKGYIPPPTPQLSIGTPLPKIFVNAVDRLVTDSRVNKLYKRYLEEVRPEFSRLAVELGFPEEKLYRDYIYRGYKDKVKPSAVGITRPFKEKKPAQLKKRALEEFTGEKNPIWATAQALTELRIASANHLFIKETLEKYGIKAAKNVVQPDGYVPFKPQGALGFFPIKDAGGKMIAGVTKKVPTYYLPKEIGEALTKFTTPVNISWYEKAWGAPLRLWKGSVTSLFAAFHIRNMEGNVYNSWLGGVSPLSKSYADAMRLQAGHKINILGYSSKELKMLAEDLGVVKTGFYGKDMEGLIDDTFRTKEHLKKDVAAMVREQMKVRNAKDRVGKVINAPRAFGTIIEDNAKLAHFIDKIKAGLTPEDAARSVKKYLFDYSELTQFEKRTFRNIFPFYTWTRKNIPLQLETLVKQPGKIHAIGTIYNSLPKGEEGDIDGLPSYIKEGLFVSLPGGAEGKKKFMYSISNLPIEDINRLFRGSVSRTAERELIGMMAPALQTVISLLTKHEYFYDQTYEEYAYTAGRQAVALNLPKPLMEYLEYREETFTLKSGKDKGKEITRYHINAAKWKMITATPLSRFITTFSSKDPAGAFFSPLKVRDFDIELGKSLRDKEFLEKINDQLLEKGILKEFPIQYVPKEEEELGFGIK